MKAIKIYKDGKVELTEKGYINTIKQLQKDLTEKEIELNMLKASAINKQLTMLQKENKELKQEIERLSRFETERVKKLNEENELLRNQEKISGTTIVELKQELNSELCLVCDAKKIKHLQKEIQEKDYSIEEFKKEVNKEVGKNFKLHKQLQEQAELIFKDINKEFFDCFCKYRKGVEGSICLSCGNNHTITEELLIIRFNKLKKKYCGDKIEKI